MNRKISIVSIVGCETFKNIVFVLPEEETTSPAIFIVVPISSSLASERVIGSRDKDPYIRNITANPMADDAKANLRSVFSFIYFRCFRSITRFVVVFATKDKIYKYTMYTMYIGALLMLEDLLEDIKVGLAERTGRDMSKNSFHRFLDETYMKNMPVGLARNFRYEREMLKQISAPVDRILDELHREKSRNYSNPQDIISADINDLVKFDDKKKQKELSRTIWRALEEVHHMYKVMFYEVMDAYDTKLNTPFMRFIGTRDIKDEFTPEYVFEFMNALEKGKEELREEAGKRFNTRKIKLKDTDEEELDRIYKSRIRVRRKRNMLRESKNMPVPDSISRGPRIAGFVDPEERLREDLKNSVSRYNGIVSKAVGVTASVLGYGWNKLRQYTL